MSIKLLLAAFMLSVSVISITAYAAGQANSNLSKQRNDVIHRYVEDLQKADVADISSLFVANGFVISTSRGEVNAHDFFSAFLPNITNASTQLHQLFQSKDDLDRMAARFHFSFTMTDGESGEGEYVDEFVFAANSDQLQAVYMFENLKFANN